MSEFEGSFFQDSPVIYYFAYGSNMDAERLGTNRLNKEGVFLSSRTLGVLNGFALKFNKPSAYFIGAGAANIIEEKCSQVYGTLNKMPEAGLAILDRYENVASGQYQRLLIDVIDCNENLVVQATTYISRTYNIEGLKPRAAYMQHVLGGADLLPTFYIDWLKTFPVAPD